MITATFITADIVNSMQLSDTDMLRLRSEIEHVLTRNGCMHEFFRYDSFQALHREPLHSLAMALEIRAAVKLVSNMKSDIRLNLTLGEVPAVINSLALSKEEVFVISGRNFDLMSEKGKRFDMILTEHSPVSFQPGMSAIALTCQFLLDKITGKQAEILIELLRGNTQKGITLKLQKSPSTISKHVKALAWEELEEINMYYRAMTDYINQ